MGSILLVMLAAKERHRNQVFWGFIAVFIGVLALIPLVFLRASKKGRQRWLQEQQESRELARKELEEDEEARERARARARADLLHGQS